jgi:hypothetical protein
MTARLRSTTVLLVLATLGCKASPQRPADQPGPSVSGKRDLTGFTNLEVNGALEADVTAGPAFSVEVSGDQAAVAGVRTKVQGETLVVGREGSASGKVHVSVKLPSLRGVEISGASKLVAAGLAGDIRVGASGASHLHASATKGEHMAIDASGASRVEIAGAVDDLVIDVSGASTVDARDLVVRKAVVDVSGASTLKLNGQDISGDASGASNVQVWGAPARLAVEATGASSVKSMQ